jgi:hypothetical protein
MSDRNPINELLASHESEYIKKVLDDCPWCKIIKYSAYAVSFNWMEGREITHHKHKIK